MKYKAGDTVRIRSKEWMDGQEKDGEGDIHGGVLVLDPDMQRNAGKTVVVESVDPDGYYRLKGIADYWQDWMFDPGYRPDEPLSAEDAIRAMLDGETLYDEDGFEYWFSGAEACFNTDSESKETPGDINYFYGLHRRPARRKRSMTRWEILAWANSEESRGWVVRIAESSDWLLPQYHGYTGDTGTYQRARILPDLSGIDENTVQGFETEAGE